MSRLKALTYLVVPLAFGALGTSFLPKLIEKRAAGSSFFGLIRVQSAAIVPQDNDPQKDCGVRYRVESVDNFRGSEQMNEFWLSSLLPLTPTREYVVILRPTSEIDFAKEFTSACAGKLTPLAVEHVFPLDSIEERNWPHEPDRIKRCGPPPYMHDSYSMLAVPKDVASCLVVPECKSSGGDGCLPWYQGMQLISWPELRAYLQSLPNQE